ncbi:MAG TPA: hypothetical protein GX520_01420 [Syntrophaceticus sp.]|jgi:hypothetical protein|nr:hypothetical protein [Syntrophaceticus schinkii]MDD4261344.1 hypothetical protein [Syntrophaceticus schinkii]HHY29344.1 hypothetical protein [Syntrophaceticus sp.]
MQEINKKAAEKFGINTDLIDALGTVPDAFSFNLDSRRLPPTVTSDTLNIPLTDCLRLNYQQPIS